MSSQSVKVSDIMTKKLETVRSSSTAQDVAIRMRDKQISSVLVIDGWGLQISFVMEVCITRLLKRIGYDLL